ncbi:hypothetical protein [Aquipseudomonas guryensis]|jgi:hypothetical protein|uniref:Uncharacterized protein n=1 Tax=Aquipseudomonas guryensis TaxID=2759165 RepID=A0A7W4H510_9GAMM|nr:hypothetical protein [Pseudomonas guryensis]MBB1519882.1 hypothetical protein [Pseudomonas guryensis]
MPDVRIETLEQQGRQVWRVRVGRRALTFHEELAARTFAAQLHIRLDWLSRQAQADSADSH